MAPLEIPPAPTPLLQAKALRAEVVQLRAALSQAQSAASAATKRAERAEREAVSLQASLSGSQGAAASGPADPDRLQLQRELEVRKTPALLVGAMCTTWVPLSCVLRSGSSPVQLVHDKLVAYTRRTPLSLQAPLRSHNSVSALSQLRGMRTRWPGRHSCA